MAAHRQCDGSSEGPGHAPGPSRPADPFERSDPPFLALTLWPNRSLTRRGFSRFLALLATGLAIPLLPFLGTAVGWALLPFMLVPLVGMYLAIRRNNADGRLVEELRLWPDLITVERREPRGAVQRWHANPHWVSVSITEDARIESYLTLTGNGREIELGAFLSPEERTEIFAELRRALAGLGSAPVPAR